MKTLIFLFITLNLFAIDFTFSTKINLPENISIEQVKKATIHSEQNGSFIFDIPHKSNQVLEDINGLIIAVNNNNQSVIIKKIEQSLRQKKQSFILTNGLVNIPWDSYEQQIVSYRTGNLILKTLSNNGFMVYEEGYITYRPVEIISVPGGGGYFGFQKEMKRIVKYNTSGKAVETVDLPESENMIINLKSFGPTGIEFINNTINSKTYDSYDEKTVIVAKINTEASNISIIFYRLTDPDFLPSLNRITLGSSQNGSLTATVNNPEQAFLNIQSSTNLIDWNTFKTIKNEPSLEIVVPANKPKEFIRAIE